MINLRYHIVSITAVFLALGIGLTLGSTFLDRVTVDTLKSQLDTVQSRVNETNARNDALQIELTRERDIDDAFAEHLPAQLLAGRLEGVPLLVVATRGTDEQLVEATVAALAAADAEVAGTWWLTDRWDLDDADERAELGEVLGVVSDQPDRLRRNAAIQLGEELATAARDGSPGPGDGEGSGEAAEGTGEDDVGDQAGERQEGAGSGAASDDEVDGADEVEAPIAAALIERGFIDSRRPDGGREGPVVPAGEAVRYVVVSSLRPDAANQEVARALAEHLAAPDNAISVVAAQGLADLSVPEGEPPVDADPRITFVGPLRSAEDIAARLSTVDHLDHAAGLVALVLAVGDLGDEVVGHYGVGADAARLLPAPRRP
ncbi:MAG: copper transporter [Acidimicrobiia bacterium]